MTGKIFLTPHPESRTSRWPQFLALGLSFGLCVGLSAMDSKAMAQRLDHDWVSSRHAGMGFAATAASYDSEAPFSNPAGLARMRNPRSRNGIHEIEIPRFSVLGSQSDLMRAAEGLASRPETALDDALANASDSGNTFKNVEARISPSIVFGGKSAATWVLSMTGDFRSTVVHESAQPAGQFEITRDRTVGAVLGVAGSSRGGTFSYGFSVRPNFRYFQVTPDSDLQSLDLGLSSSPLTLPRTMGIGIDGGILFTAADFWLPTLGLAIRNLPTGCADGVINPFTGKPGTVCGTLRRGESTEGEIRTQVDPMELRLGVSMTPRFRVGPDRLNLRIAAEASPIALPQGDASYGMSDVPIEQMLKVGAEIFFGHPLQKNDLVARGGIFLGEPTWGASLNIWFLSLDYASFVRLHQFQDESTTVVRQHLIGISASL